MTTGRRQEDTGTVASDLLWINYIQTKCRVKSAVAIEEIQSSRENFQFEFWGNPDRLQGEGDVSSGL